MITASIVVYKTETQELETILGCVLNSIVERIYIIDNSPTDELREFAMLSSKIEYIYGHGNVGYGGAHNIAIREAVDLNSTYHIIINPDIQFEQDVVEKLAIYMNVHKSVGQIMPKIIYPDGELQYLCKLLPHPIDLIGRRFIPVKRFVEKRNRNFEMRDSGYDKVMEVPFLSGCFMFLRVDALRKVRGFDDRFFMYCEDLDLCRRIGASGYKTVYYPGVYVYHVHKKESFKSKAMLKAHIKSAILYFNKWGWLCDEYRREINKRCSRNMMIDD